MGRVLLERFETANGQRMLASNGSAQVRIEYDALDRESARTYENADGVEIMTLDGFCRIEYAYDELYAELNSEFDRVIEELYLDTNHQPVTNALGYQMRKFVYDALNRVTQETYYAADGVTKMNSVMGYAEITHGFDRYGNENETAYYGANGWGTMDQNGVARIERIFDENGELISEKKYDLTRTLVP